MLSINNLTKTYSAKKGKAIKALDNVTLNFPENHGLIFLLGKSGSGKSTLLNIIGGIDYATSGELKINGQSSNSFTDCDFDSYRNTYVGFVFQDYNLLDNYNVGMNVAMASELQGKKLDKNAVDEILRMVDLVDEHGHSLCERRVNELSGGQKQRVAIARALIKNPKIILADEPTGALDSRTGHKLFELLKSLSDEKLIIVVSHDRESAEKFGDRIIEINDGSVVSDKTRCDIGFTDTLKTKDCTININNNFIKSRLSSKQYLMLGIGGLKIKPVRLAIAVFLSVIAFIFFGFSVTASFADEITTELKTLQSLDLSIITLKNSDKTHSNTSFSAKQLALIEDYNNGEKSISVFDHISAASIRLNEYIGVNSAEIDKLRNPYLSLAKSAIVRFAELDPLSGEKDLKLTPDERFKDKKLCQLPQAYDEVAITDLKADIFFEYGYINKNGTVLSIEKADDLIGLELNGLKICGVYSTEQNANYFRALNINDYGLSDDEINRRAEMGMVGSYNLDIDTVVQNYVLSAPDSILCYGFVHQGFFANKLGIAKLDQIMLKLSGDLGKDKSLIKSLNLEENGVEYNVSIISAINNFINRADFFKEFIVVPIILSVIFTVFSALLMMNFLNISIDNRKKELGVLRALGAGKKDLTLICLVESMLIALIDFTLAIFGVCITCFVINKLYYISLFNVGIVTVLSLLALCFGVAALSTIIPVLRLVHKRPIDIINDK